MRDAGPIRGRAAVPDWPPSQWTDDEDRRRRRALFDRLYEAWVAAPEVPADDPRGFVEAHLESAMPTGWVAHFRVSRARQHLPAEALTLEDHEWKIVPKGADPDSDQSYYVVFLDRRERLVFVYGNADQGPDRPETQWERSVAIPLLKLGIALPFIFARPHEFSPNYFSAT